MKKAKQKTYDIIVGIPSYNEADSISFVVEQVDEGLQKYFKNLRCQIVNVDNNSPDDTKKAFLETKTATDKIYISTPPGIKGKGNNFLNLFKHAVKVNAKAVIVVDADLKSITPEWIKKLGEPIINGKDFSSPLYIRHKYDATITNNLVFPLIYSLFNTFIRQPIGGEFAFSRKLVEKYLEQEWSETTRQYGIDVFMTLNALLGDFSIECVLLGAKIHKASAPKLGQMFIHVVTSLFDVIIKNRETLSKMRKSGPKPDYKLPSEEPPPVKIDVKKIESEAKELFEKNEGLLKKLFNDDFVGRLNEIFKEDGLFISSEIWADIVLEFLDIYFSSKHKPELIESLKGIYLARVCSFIKETENMTSIEAEKLIIKQAEIFSKKKKCLSWLYQN